MIATLDAATTPVPGRAPAGEVNAAPADESGAETEAPIGQKDDAIRVLTFSSGGIDSAMQLGVIHA
jgi:hypothetical protein